MKSASKKRAPSIVNLTVKRRYLTEREIERLMDCARKHGRYGQRDATISWSPTATACEPRRSATCNGSRSSYPRVACMCTASRTGLPALHLADPRPGKGAHHINSRPITCCPAPQIKLRVTLTQAGQIESCQIESERSEALAELDQVEFTEGHELDRKWRVPKAMIGRRLSQEEAKRLLAKFGRSPQPNRSSRRRLPPDNTVG